MPAYTVAATAVTLGVPSKWVDNVLSHYRVPGVSQRRQGVSRRLSPEAVLVLDLALKASRSLGMPLPQAIELARKLVVSPHSLEIEDGFSITIDLALIRADLSERIAHAVEIAPVPRRGRPPGP